MGNLVIYKDKKTFDRNDLSNGFFIAHYVLLVCLA